MRKEYKLQFEALFRILWVVVFALFYALGGIQFKWIRRFVAPVWLGGGLYLFSRDWWKVFQIVLLIPALHAGYGADVLFHKLFRRGLYGLYTGITPVWMFIQKGAWRVYLVNFLLCIAVSVVFGVWNPFESARIEGLTIGFTVGWLSIMTARRRDGNSS